MARFEGACSSKDFFLVEIPLEFGVALGMGIWTWYKSRQALKPHDDGDGRLVLLPAYQMFLYAFMINLSIYAIINCVYYIDDIRLDTASWKRSVLTMVWNGALYATMDGIPIWLTKSSTGTATMRRVAVQSLVWGGIQGGLAVGLIHYPNIFLLYLTTPLNLLRTIMYLCVWLAPMRWVYRRPSARLYAKWIAIYNLLFSVLFLIADLFLEALLCLIFSSSWIIVIGLPFLLYSTLLMDSHYWRGLLDDQPHADNTNVSLRAPLMGISLTEQTASALTEELDASSIKAKHLNYALLSLGQPRDDGHQSAAVGNLLAAGGTARVYAGSYKGETLAIKLIYCLELTPDIVRNFARESNKLAALNKYPHVVKLIGICVRPPSLAMALELCYFGSLYDVIERHYQPSGHISMTYTTDSLRTTHTEVYSSGDKHIVLDRRTRLIMALHCSRAVAMMHSLSPPLLHLDLKAQNFLVALRSSTPNERKQNLIDDHTPYIVKVADLELSTHADDENIRIPDTHQWTAPELLTGKMSERQTRVSTSSDIFALACVFYEIETGRTPYSEHSQDPRIVERIIGSESLRPLPTNDNMTIDHELVTLMRLCWHHDPIQRPSATIIVQLLTDMIASCPS